MKFFEKFLALFALTAFLILGVASVPAFSAVVIEEDGTQEGIVEKINVSTDLDVSVNGNTASITTESSQTLTSGTTFVGIQQQYSAPSPTDNVLGLYFQLYVYDAQFSPASGAPAGSVKIIRNAGNANGCGHQAGGSTFNICVSDGTNWKKL